MIKKSLLMMSLVISSLSIASDKNPNNNNNPKPGINVNSQFLPKGTYSTYNYNTQQVEYKHDKPQEKTYTNNTYQPTIYRPNDGCILN